MEQRSAWTANVWGGNAAARNAVGRKALKAGEEPCPVCLDSAVQVGTEPCKHKTCYECCNKMRANNVFKVNTAIVVAAGGDAESCASRSHYVGCLSAYRPSWFDQLTNHRDQSGLAASTPALPGDTLHTHVCGRGGVHTHALPHSSQHTHTLMKSPARRPTRGSSARCAGSL